MDVVAVRINAVGTPWAEEDLAALADTHRAVMVPKATTSSVRHVDERLIGNTAIIALIETAAGVAQAQAIAASPRVARLAFGSLDLASELRVSPTDTMALLTARSALVLASASAGLPGPVDGVTANLQDATVLRADIEHARRLGFSGKLCIHPNQIDTALALLSPNHEEILWAERVLQLATDVATDAGGVAVLDGQMIDKPVVDRARRILGLRH
jgi:citrate lyase subunit beta/citryl-CoA lyase